MKICTDHLFLRHIPTEEKPQVDSEKKPHVESSNNKDAIITMGTVWTRLLWWKILLKTCVNISMVRVYTWPHVKIWLKKSLYLTTCEDIAVVIVHTWPRVETWHVKAHTWLHGRHNVLKAHTWPM